MANFSRIDFGGSVGDLGPNRAFKLPMAPPSSPCAPPIKTTGPTAGRYLRRCPGDGRLRSVARKEIVRIISAVGGQLWICASPEPSAESPPIRRWDMAAVKSPRRAGAIFAQPPNKRPAFVIVMSRLIADADSTRLVTSPRFSRRRDSIDTRLPF